MFPFNLLRKKEDHNAPLPAAEHCGAHFSGAVVSDTGCLRTNNEDNYLLDRNRNERCADFSEYETPAPLSGWQMAGVFDGMGGGEAGEIAAAETAAIFRTAAAQLTEAASRDAVDTAVRKAYLDANNRIVDLQQQFQMFGTTGTVLVSNGAVFRIYHLGDSRAYLLRDGDLMQLTTDQTLAQMKQEAGLYRGDERTLEADRHKLVEYIGRDWTRAHIAPVESCWMEIQPGDAILLCSDGLYDMCTDREIADILCAPGTSREKAAALVQRAKANGGEDNVTCLVAALS